jgi:hypothetical protein
MLRCSASSSARYTRRGVSGSPKAHRSLNKGSGPDTATHVSSAYVSSMDMVSASSTCRLASAASPRARSASTAAAAPAARLTASAFAAAAAAASAASARSSAAARAVTACAFACAAVAAASSAFSVLRHRESVCVRERVGQSEREWDSREAVTGVWTRFWWSLGQERAALNVCDCTYVNESDTSPPIDGNDYHASGLSTRTVFSSLQPPPAPPSVPHAVRPAAAPTPACPPVPPPPWRPARSSSP